MTIEEVAERLECSSSKISRIETGRVNATARDVRDIIDIYDIGEDQRDELVQLAREARKKGWLHAYSDLPFVTMADMETAASSIRMYSASLVPGLLQTMDYARAVIRAIRLDLPPEEIDRRVEVRKGRQAVLSRDDPPMLWVVLDEAALRRVVGGPEAMRAQLHRLTECTALPNVTLQVLPFTAGAHSGMDGEFTVLSFVEAADPDVVFIENTMSDLYLEKTDEIRRYNLLFDHLRAKALDPAHSADFFAQVAKEL